MQITFRPNHGRPPQKFESPQERFDGPETAENVEPGLDETLETKMGFVMEEEQYVAEKQNYQELGWSGCKPGWPGHKPGCPDNKPDWGGPNYPPCPDIPNKPDCPDNKPDSACDPYPYPGNYYPLQCLGYAYIPWQTFHRQYQANEALQKGTLFPELYSPYFPERNPPVIPRPYCNMWQCSNMNRNRKG